MLGSSAKGICSCCRKNSGRGHGSAMTEAEMHHGTHGWMPVCELCLLFKPTSIFLPRNEWLAACALTACT